MMDEFMAGDDNHVQKNTGYMYNKHELRYSTWNTLGFLNNYLCHHSDSKLKGGYDSDPDEFRFNFLDYGGSIYLSCDSIWKVKCDRNLKVEKVNIGEVPIYLGYVEERLTKEGNNHFGIKCHKDWTGEGIYHDDDKLQECSRKDAYIKHI